MFDVKMNVNFLILSQPSCSTYYTKDDYFKANLQHKLAYGVIRALL